MWSRQSGNVPFRLCRRLASALGKINELTTLENAVRGDGQPLEGTRGGTDQKLEAAQCAALKVVGPHGLEPWTKGL